MSSSDNPYLPYRTPEQSGQLPVESLANSLPYRPIQSFDVVRYIKSPFVSPNWMMNLVWMFVCEALSIVVIGNVISMGYNMVVAEARSGGRDQIWPDFEFEKFTEYLMRGLWPFLWNLIGSFVLVFVSFVPAISTILLVSSLNNGDQFTNSSIIVACIGGFATVSITVVAVVAMLATMLHSGLSNDFLKGADLGWASSFVSKMVWQVILVGFISWIIAIVGLVVGMLLFCIGLIVVGPFMRLLMSDAIAQLHDIFVSRGGRPAFEVIQPESTIIDATVLQ